MSSEAPNGHNPAANPSPEGAEATHAFGFETRAVHAGHRPNPYTGASAVPIYQTAAFVFEDTDSAAAYFNLQEYGNIYSRIMNPTVAVFEERIANLEGGAGAVAFGSGLGAQAGVIFTALQPGDHVVAARAIYGGTISQFKNTLSKLSVEFSFIDGDDPAAWESAITPKTKLVLRRDDRQPRRQYARHSHGGGRSPTPTASPLMVDNTFATPVLCRPIRVGRGYRRAFGDEVYRRSWHAASAAWWSTPAHFDWSNGRFPSVADPSPAYHGLKFHETFGTYGFLMKTARGGAARPRLAAQPVQRLPLHARPGDAAAAHGAPRRERARAWRGSSKRIPPVEPCATPAWTSSPYHALAQRYLPRGAGAVFAFDLRGGRAAGQRFIEALQLWRHLANVGDTKSLVIHPASSTHRQLSDEDLAATGISLGTIRLSVGLETLDDLLWDLEHGLRAARLPRPRRRRRRHTHETETPQSSRPCFGGVR